MANEKKNDKPLDKLPTPSEVQAPASTQMANVLSPAETMLAIRKQVDAQDEAEGFERFNPLDGLRIFYQPIEGAALRGVLLGRFPKDGPFATTEDGEQNYWYQVQLTAPYDDCKMYQDKVPIAYAGQIGDVVIVDERYAMTCIAPVLERAQREGLKIELLLRSLGKTTTSAKRRVWLYDIKGRMLPKAQKLNQGAPAAKTLNA